MRSALGQNWYPYVGDVYSCFMQGFHGCYWLFACLVWLSVAEYSAGGVGMDRFCNIPEWFTAKVAMQAFKSCQAATVGPSSR